MGSFPPVRTGMEGISISEINGAEVSNEIELTWFQGVKYDAQIVKGSHEVKGKRTAISFSKRQH